MPLNTPPTILKRNEYGLLENIDYKFTSDGFVDWKAMIPKTKEHYAINKDRTKEEDITKVDDKDLLLLLFAFKELVRIRGINYIRYPILQLGQDECSIVCEISWLPNFETEGRTVISSGCGSANFRNTKGFGSNFLTPIGENRAFVRCVRNYLGINILGFDELGDSKLTENNDNNGFGNSLSPVGIFKKLMEDRNIAFSNIKNKLIKEKFPNAETFEKVEDIPVTKILNYIERIKAKTE